MAAFYVVSPREVLALPLDEFLTWEAQAWRIVREREERGRDGSSDG